MSKTHLIGAAIYIPENKWHRHQEYLRRTRRRLEWYALTLWLKPPDTVKEIIHIPGSAGAQYDPLEMVGSVGVKYDAEHRWPEHLGHTLMRMRRMSISATISYIEKHVDGHTEEKQQYRW